MLMIGEKHDEKVANMEEKIRDMQATVDAVALFIENRDDYIAERDSWQHKLDA